MVSSKPFRLPVFLGCDDMDPQEEPLNNGAWTYVGPRILTAANETQYHKGKYPYYAGRQPTGSVATGSKVRVESIFSCSLTNIPCRFNTRKRLRSSLQLHSLRDEVVHCGISAV